jgi:hypothetical protein
MALNAADGGRQYSETDLRNTTKVNHCIARRHESHAPQVKKREEEQEKRANGRRAGENGEVLRLLAQDGRVLDVHG